MADSRDNLIKDLVADLKPVERPGRIARALAVWLVIASAYSVFVVLATGPLRPGAIANLVAEIPFAFETLLAVAAILALARAALRTSLPGVASFRRHLAWPLLLTGGWVAFYVVGLWYPAHPVSTLGQRDHCIWQALLFSLPTLAFMLVLARRLLPLRPRLTGGLAGAAAAAIPGALMQFACMYVPAHILTHHLGPVLMATGIGVLVGPVVLARRRTVPRRRDVSVH